MAHSVSAVATPASGKSVPHVRARAESRNNFDALRLGLALIVAFYHLAVLTRRPEYQFLHEWLSADFAVKGFFVVSGFLVTQSLRNSSSVTRYFEKRARRLLPGYIAVVVLAWSAGMALTSWPLADYLFSAAGWKYLFWNLVFLNYKADSLPGVFGDNALTAVNGALWTIKVEVSFYAALPLILLAMRWIGVLPLAIALYVGSVAWKVGMLKLGTITGNPSYVGFAEHLPGQLSYFVCGMLVQMLSPSRRTVAIAAVAALAIALTGALGRAFAEPVLYGAIVMAVALYLPYLGNAARFGDFSYGLYLVHFPLLQTMIALGAFAHPVAGAIVYAVILGTLAWLSWTFIEQPFLLRSSHYRQTSEKPPVPPVRTTQALPAETPAP